METALNSLVTTNILLLFIAVLLTAHVFGRYWTTVKKQDLRDESDPLAGPEKNPVLQRAQYIGDLLQQGDDSEIVLFVMAEHALALKIEEIEEALVEGDDDRLRQLLRTDLEDYEDREGIYDPIWEIFRKGGRKVKPMKETLLQKLNALFGLGGK